MSTPIPVLDPDYFRRFHCLGTECEDTCCSGMGVVIDKSTYLKYKSLPTSGLKVLVDKHVSEIAISTSDSTYAQITSPGSACPFLTEQQLCGIQLTLGEDYLSRTCSVYPRAMNVVDGVVERTLYMSCPEAARVVLLNPEKMEFYEADVPDDRRYIDFPVLNTESDASSQKPYSHFIEIRQLIVSILQDRYYEVWERLVIVGLFCERLNILIDEYKDNEIPGLIESFQDHVSADQFREPIAGVTSQHGLQVRSLIEALDYRVNKSNVGVRFLDCYSEFLQGIMHESDAPQEEIEANYTSAYNLFYQPYMADKPYILEHYVVNYVLKNLFPLGPQESLYYVPKSVFDEFVYLVIHYFMVRTLLVGIAGYHRTHFGDDIIVKLIQSFAKDIEHDTAFLARISDSLADSNMTSMAFLAVLLKD